MPILDSSHDHMHAVEGDSAWSESYYFNAYDPDSDTGFFTRIGIRPNDGTMDVVMNVWLPDTGLATVRAVRDQSEMCESPLEVGGVTYRCAESGQSWVITADSDGRRYDRTGAHRSTRLQMDAQFCALTPMIGVDGQGKSGSGASAHTGSSVGKGHLEQAGRWQGWIQVDDMRFDFGENVRGNRDKSWGPRRWGGPKMWRWFSVNISDEVHFGGIRIGTDGGDLHRGWVWRDGAHASVRRWDVRTRTASDGVTQKACEVTAHDSLGRSHDLRAEVMRVVPGGSRPGETIVNEGLAKWTYEGVTGYGIAEYLHQFDDDGHPLVPIE